MKKFKTILLAALIALTGNVSFAQTMSMEKTVTVGGAAMYLSKKHCRERSEQ